MNWTLFDYGVGNIHSLRKALESCGANVEVTRTPEDLAEADVVVLPGVGAFGAVMETLGAARELLRGRHEAKRPTLGICIGLQAFFSSSEESPGAEGVGLFDAPVVRLPASAGKIPHMGWNSVAFDNDPLFAGVPKDAYVYYVHSYAAAPVADTLATTRYGMVFTAALRSGATLGLQFHPEKSSAVGRAILANAVRELEAAA